MGTNKINADVEIRALTWDVTGQFYGYPRCCIDAFVARSTTIFSKDKFIPFDEIQSKVSAHGFVPCPACAAKVTRETIGTLITDRVCSFPFPEDANNPKVRAEIDAELDNFVDQLISSHVSGNRG